MKKTNKIFAGIISVALIGAAVINSNINVMEMIKNNGTEIEKAEVIKEPEKAKKEVKQITLNLSKENRFEHYTIMYNDSYDFALDLDDLLHKLNEATDDTYLLTWEDSKLMKVEDKKVVPVNIVTVVERE